MEKKMKGFLRKVESFAPLLSLLLKDIGYSTVTGEGVTEKIASQRSVYTAVCITSHHIAHT